MSRLKTKDIIEIGAWLLFALLAYLFSLEFDKDIETYRFGAYVWPRTIIILIVIAALLQLYTTLRKAEHAADQQSAETDDDAQGAVKGWGSKLRIAAFLGLPFCYAALLESIGFYTLTPFFILGFLLLSGERRWPVLLGASIGIYAILLLCFARLFYINLPVGNWSPFYDFSNWLLVLIR